MRSAFARRAPILILAYPLLVLAVAAGLAAGEGGGEAGGLTLFFIGNRASEIEPCGCVKNQLGGVQYEATIYEATPRERSIRVDVGGWTADRVQPEISMRTRYALRAMGGRLDLDVVNVARQDLAHGRDFYVGLEKNDPQSYGPLVSANIHWAEAGGARVFDPYRIVEVEGDREKKVKVGIVGVTSEGTRGAGPRAQLQNDPSRAFKISNPADAVQSALSEMKGKVDFTIALVHGSWSETVEIAQVNPRLDLIVSSSRGPNYPSTSETVGRTKIVSVHNSLGKELGKIRIARAGGAGRQAAGEPEWIGISPKKFQPVQELVDLIADYKKNTEELIIAVPRDVERVYAGAQYCGTCHIEQYRSWRKTDHADALAALVSKGSQYETSCLQCHTVGFGKDNGFYNVRQSRPMANVQCESCHGPAYEHAMKQNLIKNRSVNRLKGTERERFFAEARELIPPAKVEASTCIVCHQGDNDPNFDYESKIHKVDHSGIRAP